MIEVDKGNSGRKAAGLERELMLRCQSESLTEGDLRELIDRHGLTANNHHVDNYEFFFAACRNERVTEGIIQYLLEYFPAAPSATDEGGWSPLHIACYNKNVTLKIIHLLIHAAPKSVCVATNGGHMPLHHLCSNKRVNEENAVQILRFLLEKCPEAVRHGSNNGFLPIHTASRWRSLEFCRVLIAAYPGSERITNVEGALSLHYACYGGSLATVKYLYSQYPEAIHRADSGGRLPIHDAISDINSVSVAAVESVKFLLDCDSDQKLIQLKGKTLLHCACAAKYDGSDLETCIQMIKVIFDAHPASARIQDNDGRMPLHILCINCKVDGAAAVSILEFLIEKHSEAVRHVSNSGHLPIHNAAWTKSPEFCRVLIEAYPGSERMTDASNAAVNGRYPIHYAIGSVIGRDNPATAVQVVQFLLDCDPDQKLVQFQGASLLHFACGEQYDDSNIEAGIQLIKVVFDAHPVSVCILDNHGRMPLHVLCCNRKVDGAAEIQILKFLLEKHQEAVQHVDNEGHLPIHIASRRGRSPEFCRVLIEAYPGSERMTNNNGALPLHRACLKGSLATVEYLYKLFPESINHTATQGHYPIHYAISNMTHRDNPATAVEIVQFLLDCDPNQKLTRFQGASLLHCACAVKQNDKSIEAGIQMIKAIFDAHPASIRSINNKGQSPLLILCNNRKVDETAAVQILKFLIEKAPDAVRHADTQGFLPIHIAAAMRSPEFCRVLIEAYPGSEQITDTNGLLPLHQACATNSLSSVEYLYKLYPEAINRATIGVYPIHAAIVKMVKRDNPATSVEIVQFLLNCDPNQKLKQYQGRSLLRLACKRGYNDSNIGAALDVIKIIFDAHPEAIEDNRIASNIHRSHQQVQAFISGELVYARQAKDHRLMTTPDDNGRLPLHTALQNNVRLGSIRLLVKGNPSAITNADTNFAMPLHIACQHHDSASVVQYLIGLDRGTLNALDKTANSALHYACRGAKHDTIAMLLENYDAVSVSKRNAHGKLPIDLLWESNAVEDRVSLEYMESVFQLLRVYPEMFMIGNSIVSQPVDDVGATSNGKKRKFGHDHED